LVAACTFSDVARAVGSLAYASSTAPACIVHWRDTSLHNGVNAGVGPRRLAGVRGVSRTLAASSGLLFAHPVRQRTEETAVGAQHCRSFKEAAREKTYRL
jgi:hypothetical protein